MSTRVIAIAIAAVAIIAAACGGNDDAASNEAAGTGTTPAAAGSAVAERIHARYLISEFERDSEAATKRFGGKFVTFESFVDKHGSNDTGDYVRVKSEPFATRFIYCYYDKSLAPEIPALESGSVVFLNGRIGEFEDVFLQVYECSIAEVELKGGGTQSGSEQPEE